METVSDGRILNSHNCILSSIVTSGKLCMKKVANEHLTVMRSGYISKFLEISVHISYNIIVCTVCTVMEE